MDKPVSNKIRIGVIGTGFGKAVHIPGFMSLGNAQVVGVAAGDAKHAREATAEFSLPEFFSSWRDMVVSTKIDAVSIATPPASHEEIALAAIRSGKAVFCEKPLALDVSSARRMRDEAIKARCVNMTGFQFRELPAMKLAKKVLDSGELGRLREVQVTWWVHSWADPLRPWSWRSDAAQGGGTLAGFASHVLDYILWLAGPATSVAADITTEIPCRPNAGGSMRTVTGDDSCRILLRTAQGTPVSVLVSTVATVGRGHWIEFHGEKAMLRLGSDDPNYGRGFDLWRGDFTTKTLQPLPLRESGKDANGTDGRLPLFISLAGRFVRAVQEGNTAVTPSFNNGFQVQQLMEAARQANRERRWVDVSGD